MGNQNSAAVIRALLPAPVRRTLRRAKTYVDRLAVWVQVARHIKGCTPRDRAILRRAMLSAPFDSWRGLDEWRDASLDEDCTVETIAGTFKVRANTDELAVVLPTRERAVVRVMQEMLGPDDCFVDAGANIGDHTLLGSRLAGQVIAIEMMPETVKRLRDNVRANGRRNIEIVEAALSDVVGETVQATIEAGKSSQASIAVNRGRRTVPVLTTTLTNILQDIPSVRLLKIDIEGAELPALRGAPLHKIEAILFEDWGASTLSNFLASQAFDVRRIDAANSVALRKVEMRASAAG